MVKVYLLPSTLSAWSAPNFDVHSFHSSVALSKANMASACTATSVTANIHVRPHPFMDLFHTALPSVHLPPRHLPMSSARRGHLHHRRPRQRPPPTAARTTHRRQLLPHPGCSSMPFLRPKMENPALLVTAARTSVLPEHRSWNV